MKRVIVPVLGLICSFPTPLFAQTGVGEIINLPGLAFKYSIETTAGKDTVWRLWTDVENWKRFDTSLEYSHLTDSGGFREGATGYLKAKNAPRTGFEILQIDEGKSFLVRLKLPLSRIDQQRYFEVNDNGRTTFTHEVGFHGVLSPLIYFVLRGIYKKETRKVVEELKLVAESEENRARRK